MYKIIIINVLYSVTVHQVGNLARVYHTLSSYVRTFVFSSIFLWCGIIYVCLSSNVKKADFLGRPVPALGVKNKFDTCLVEHHEQSSFEPPFKVLLDIF